MSVSPQPGAVSGFVSQRPSSDSAHSWDSGGVSQTHVQAGVWLQREHRMEPSSEQADSPAGTSVKKCGVCDIPAGKAGYRFIIRPNMSNAGAASCGRSWPAATGQEF